MYWLSKNIMHTGGKTDLLRTWELSIYKPSIGLLRPRAYYHQKITLSLSGQKWNKPIETPLVITLWDSSEKELQIVITICIWTNKYKNHI
ncbi:hypothetical protein CEXT_286471 [Caerostris extrusa]|uniref:Uncharacterized protein n=1 Tax=Caerostris extrusa TaxID=172846 RepID=A0AAV4VML0_CAEEX|nr:hypothetical protein CEXT_286471 [Caerostris extrusa]